MNSKIRRVTAILVLQMGVFGFVSLVAQVADPTISIVGTSSTSSQTAFVTLSDTAPGAVIYYTTDGTVPTTASSTIANGGTVLISQNATVNVQAYSGTIPSSLVTAKYSNAGMVSAGARHTLILKSDGTVWATGDNTYGELGNGGSVGNGSLYPMQVMESSGVPLTGIVNVAAGTDESFAVDGSGNVWAWGYNPNGQLGIGNSSNALYAEQITSLSNIISIASNQYHTLALQADGVVWSWGANTSGQVGNGAASSWVTQPTEVVAPTGQSGYLGGIVAVAAGASHSVALDNTGKVWAWGADGSGQLGDADSTLTSQPSPVSVLKNGSALVNVIGIAANATNSFALRNDGTVYAWGNNSTGELGTGTITASLSAIQVNGLTGPMASLGNEVAVDSNGMVWSWGANDNGQLGIGYTGYYSTLPLEVNPLAPTSPAIGSTAGNGQNVTDGAFSGPITITASSDGSPVQGAWVNLVVNPTSGFLGLNSGATLLSPIIGGLTNSSGQISFYLQSPANGSGTVSLTATSGTSQATLSAIEQMAQSVATDTPTMPEWALILMALLLLWNAGSRKVRLTR